MSDNATTDAYIALGSNLGDREANLREALRRLGELPGTELVRESSFMETEPVDSPEGAGMFLNGAAWLKTSLPPRGLLAALLEIERAMGRDRTGQPRNAPRTLDLDLLLYGDRIIEEEDLQVPHPRMHEREFVLWPLLQIASKLKDPRTGEPYAEAYARLKNGRTQSHDATK
ncbi:MAG: 2-amino-4-hydroxy-6-hydroxymethyldihydropteridine diphosphokinase [Planctomycetes bacterium]|nr:2-amino-4-hydroxy-6-hydroxymethyldihydropteridine diphosphokinase [Planctomycetota bacterium]